MWRRARLAGRHSGTRCGRTKVKWGRKQRTIRSGKERQRNVNPSKGVEGRIRRGEKPRLRNDGNLTRRRHAEQEGEKTSEALSGRKWEDKNEARGQVRNLGGKGSWDFVGPAWETPCAPWARDQQRGARSAREKCASDERKLSAETRWDGDHLCEEGVANAIKRAAHNRDIYAGGTGRRALCQSGEQEETKRADTSTDILALRAE
ncbi:hypothetical protein ERJ75_000609100 [Trypanosoma vivax]|nr:hypothetical protein ERJ75_000609100 [Trypanosoma vivax]